MCSPSHELDELAAKYSFEYKEVVVLRKVSIWQDLRAVSSTIKYIKENKRKRK